MPATTVVAATSGAAAEAAQAIRKLAESGVLLAPTEASRAAWWVPREPLPQDVEGILELYGYQVHNPEQWSSIPECGGPQLHLSLHQHFEEGHTWYLIRCMILLGESHGWTRLNWPAPRRLWHVRHGLYERVKKRLGTSYASLMGSAPFARRGGPSGTTERLHGWLASLITLINTGQVSPFICALLLEFLQAPDPKSPPPYCRMLVPCDHSGEPSGRRRSSLPEAPAVARGSDGGDPAVGDPGAAPGVAPRLVPLCTAQRQRPGALFLVPPPPEPLPCVVASLREDEEELHGD